jgi:hypothetical protein
MKSFYVCLTFEKRVKESYSQAKGLYKYFPFHNGDYSFLCESHKISVLYCSVGTLILLVPILELPFWL